MADHGSSPNGPDLASVEIDRKRPHHARVYDYLQGGTTNFEVDRAAAEAAADVYPGGLDGSRAGVQANRQFMVRTVRWLVREGGMRQFLDIGTGIPTETDNVHDIAQGEAPEARIVYVDNDDIVLAHAHGLPAGASYVHADLRDPAAVLAQAGATLDFERPVAVLLIAILHLIADTDDPYGLVEHLVDALPSGSYLAITHLTDDLAPMAAAAERINAAGATMILRDRAQVSRFLHGLELIEPGVVPVHLWRPDDTVPAPDERYIAHYGGLARKP